MNWIASLAPRFAAAGRRLSIPLADLLVLAYLWAIGTCFTSFILYGEEAYLLVPWWVMALAVVEGAALWESFGVSLGMRLFGRWLSREDDSSPSLGQRLGYWLSWHLSLPLFPLSFLDHEGQTVAERLTGTVLREPPADAPRGRWYRTSSGWAILLILFLTSGAAFGITKVNLSALIKGAPKTAKFWRSLASPDTSILTLGLKLLLETFFMAMMATVFAVVIAGPVSFLAARNLMRGPLARPVYFVVRAISSLTRSVDAIIWAIIFAVWVGMGSFCGALALWIHSIADLIKLYSEQLESIDPGPLEAVAAAGASRLEVIRYGIIPQIINPYLSFTLYRWDINVRMATVIGVVGGGGIGWRLAAHLRSWQFPEASMLTILVVALVWAIDYVSARLRAKLA
ncbi:MAG: phosphonate ABC transporter, permease protein PhnE [Candidatus Acetothermia bacterium]|jgi:phosphonate transport system permease protein|nr:phosphonate ABC transporter, permease protein PhnE [Candidatus Acetothermia bacterium]MDH7506019.1 phosphonate ABC transporter, permease protein PhnE [Candidatus Acetothermia bacterium]